MNKTDLSYALEAISTYRNLHEAGFNLEVKGNKLVATTEEVYPDIVKVCKSTEEVIKGLVNSWDEFQAYGIRKYDTTIFDSIKKALSVYKAQILRNNPTSASEIAVRIKELDEVMHLADKQKELITARKAKEAADRPIWNNDLEIFAKAAPSSSSESKTPIHEESTYDMLISHTEGKRGDKVKESKKEQASLGSLKDIFTPSTLVYPLPSPLESLKDEKLLAQIIASFMSGSIEKMQGNHCTSTLKYVIGFIDRLSSGNFRKSGIAFPQKALAKLRRECEQAFHFAEHIEFIQTQAERIHSEINYFLSIKTLLHSIVEESQKLSKQVINDLNNLPERESYVLPAGWTAQGGGHAMMYRFTKSKNNQLTLDIINTGAGVSLHTSQLTGTKLKFNVLRRFENIPLSVGLLDANFIQSIIEFKYRIPGLVVGANEVYGTALARLAKYEATTNDTSSVYATGQRSGDCAMKSVLILSRLILESAGTYKIFSHLMDMEAYEAGVELLCTGQYCGRGAADELLMIQILQRSLNKKQKSIAKMLRRNRELTEEQAKLALEQTKALKKRVSEYRKRPSAPQPQEAFTIYDPKKLAKKIAAGSNAIELVPLTSSSNETKTIAPQPTAPLPVTNPTGFVQNLKVTLQLIKHNKQLASTSPQLLVYTYGLKLYLANAFSLVNNFKTWQDIICDTELCHQAHDIMNEAIEHCFLDFQSRPYSDETPTRTSAFCNFYTTMIFVQNEILKKNSDSLFQGHALGIEMFEDYFNETPLKETLGANFHQNLEILASIKAKNPPLFVAHPRLAFDTFIFESLPLLVIIEKLLKKYPKLQIKIEEVINIEKYAPQYLHPQWKLGDNAEIKKRRMVALFVYSGCDMQMNNVTLAPFRDRHSTDYCPDYALLLSLQRMTCAVENGVYYNKGASIIRKFVYLDLTRKDFLASLDLRRVDWGRVDLIKGCLPFDIFPEGNVLSKTISLFKPQEKSTQNQLLIDGIKVWHTPKYDEIDLRMRLADPRLRIAHLIDYFDTHIEELEHFAKLVLFRARLIEGHVLVNSIIEEPKLVQKLVGFLQKQWEFALLRPHQTSQTTIDLQITLFRTVGRVLAYLRANKEALQSVRETTDVARADLLVLLNKQLEEVQKCINDPQHPAADIFGSHFLAALKSLVQDCSHLRKEEVQTTLKVLVKLFRANRDVVDSDIKCEAMEAIILLAPSIEAFIKHPSNAYFGNELLLIYDISLPKDQKWEVYFPILRAISGGNVYEINVMTGSIFANGKALHRSNISYSSKNYPDFFIKLGNLGLIPQSNGDLKGIVSGKKIHHYEASGRICLQYSGNEYTLMTYSEAESLDIPNSLIKNNICWRNNALEADPAILIYDKDFNTILAHVTRDGSIYRQESKNVVFTDLFAIAASRPYASFGRERVMAWTDSNGLSDVHYIGYQDVNGKPLSFTKQVHSLPKLNRMHLEVKASNFASKMVWNSDPSLFISSQQQLNALKGFEDYLVLRNDKDQEYVVIPCRHLWEANLGVCHVIHHSPLTGLQPNTVAESLHLMRIYFSLREYELAFHYMQKAYTSRAYSKEEFAIIDTMFSSKERDPFACLIQLYLSLQILDNIQRTLPRKQYSNIQKQWHTPPLGSLLMVYLNNRNVPRTFQPHRVLGAHRLSKVIKKILIKDEILGTLGSKEILQQYLWEISEGKPSTLERVKFPSLAPESKEILFTPHDVEFIREMPVLESKQKTLQTILQPDSLFDNFFDYYREALSDDKVVRNNLIARLDLIPESADLNIRILRYAVQTIAYWKDSQANQALNLLPKEYNKNFLCSLANALKKGPKLPTKNIPELMLSGENLDKLYDYVDPTFTLKEGEKRVQLKLGSGLGSDEPELILSRNMAADYFTHKEVIPEPPLQLVSQEQIQTLSKKLNLSSYVVKRLVELNAEVMSTPENLTCYALKPKINLNHLIDNLQDESRMHLERSHELEKEILELANGLKKDNTLIDLMRESGVIETWTLQKCMRVMQNGKWNIFKKSKIKLTDKDIRQLHKLLVRYALEKIAVKTADRAIALAEQLQAEKGTTKEASLSQELAMLLGTERHYNPYTNPTLLIFDYIQEWTIRPNQIPILKNLFEREADGTPKNIVQQFIMAGGKTTVLTPQQAVDKSNGEHLLIQLVPEAIAVSQRGTLEKLSRDLFDQRQVCIKFERGSATVDYLQTILETLEEARTYREYVFMTPTDLLSLKLTCFSYLSKLAKSTAGKNPIAIEKAEILRDIMAHIDTFGIVSIDEVHTQKPKYHVSFTLGLPSVPEASDSRMIKDLYVHILKTPKLRSIVRLHENKQHFMAPVDWQIVKAHLLKEFVKAIPGMRTEDLIHYCQGHRDARSRTTYNELLQIYSTTIDLQIKQAIRHLSLLKLELSVLMEKTLQTVAGLHHGSSQSDDSYHCSKPFEASKTPNESSEFTEAPETINKTFQMFLSSWKECNDIPVIGKAAKADSVPSHRYSKYLVQYLQRKRVNFLKVKNVHKVELLDRQFLEVTGLDLKRTDLLSAAVIPDITAAIDEKLQGAAPHEPTLLLVTDYVVDSALKTQKTFASQLIVTCQDVQGAGRAMQAYSGTLGSKFIYSPKATCIRNPETNQKVIQTLLKRNNAIHRINSENPQEVITALLNNHPMATRFRAFIDAGAVFISSTNSDVAKGFLNYFEQRTDGRVCGVIYWNDATNSPHIIYTDGKDRKIIPLITTDKAEVAATCSTIGLDFDQLFAYFDQRHTLGADIFFADNTKAFVSTSMQTELDQLSQGVMRMRKYVEGVHDVELILQREEDERIFHKMAIGERELSNRMLLGHAALCQSENELPSNYEATRQMLDFKVKNGLEKKIYYAKDIEESLKWYRILQPLTENSKSLDSFLAFGHVPNDDVSTEVALTSYADRLIAIISAQTKEPTVLAMFRQWRVEMGVFISERLREGVLPETAPAEDAISSESTRINENQKVSTRTLETSRATEQQQRAAKADLPNAYREVEWSEEVDIFHPHFSISAGTDRRVGFQTSPVVYRLSEQIRQSNSFAKIAGGMIDANILVSENFLRSSTENEDLFSMLQKAIYEVLVVAEGENVKVMLLTIKEAVFFKQKLAAQKRKGSSSSTDRRMWILHPHSAYAKGDYPVQEGDTPLSAVSPVVEARINRALLQTLVMSGNVEALQAKKEHLKAWLNEGDPTELPLRKANLLALVKQTVALSRFEIEHWKASDLKEIFI